MVPSFFEAQITAAKRLFSGIVLRDCNCSMNTAQRAAVIDPIIPRPPVDVAPLRNAFSSMVAKQWEAYLPSATAGAPLGAAHVQSVKARFIAEMYARPGRANWFERQPATSTKAEAALSGIGFAACAS